jgi:hypothetical protein
LQQASKSAILLDPLVYQTDENRIRKKLQSVQFPELFMSKNDPDFCAYIWKGFSQFTHKL